MLDKLGLVSAPSEEQIPTAELPQPDFASVPPESPPQPPEPAPEPEPELLTEQEIEISTADTRPLPPEMSSESFSTEPKMEAKMESEVTNIEPTAPELNTRTSGPLLDLGDFEPSHQAIDEDFVLDLDLDDPSESPAESKSYSEATPSSEVRMDDAQAMHEAASRDTDSEADRTTTQQAVDALAEPTVDPMAQTQELIQPVIEEAPKASAERAFTEPQILEGETLRMARPASESSQISLEQLSPEAIDAIARRAVEMLSASVVQEIAWEVVPQLAELMIKRQLEEKSS